MSYTPPTGTVDGSWSGAGSYTKPSNPLPAWWGGIDQGTGIRRLAAHGWVATNEGRPYTLHPWQYAPPVLHLDALWSGAQEYTPAPTIDAAWTKGILGGDQFVVSVSAGDLLALGLPWARNDQIAKPFGWTRLQLGKPTLEQVYTVSASWQGRAYYHPPILIAHGWWSGVPEGSLFPGGVQPGSVGQPHVRNSAANLLPIGGAPMLQVGMHRIWNWRQYSAMLGFDAALFGVHYVQGGVKYVATAGFIADAVQAPKVVNTRGAQSVVVGPGQAITPPAIAGPSVRPYIVWPRGVQPAGMGDARVQFPPRPAGWLSTAFGYATIRDKAQRLLPVGLPPGESGFPVVRDRARRLLHKSQITSEIFGDILLRLKNAYMRPDGIESDEVGRWAEVRNTRRALPVVGFVTTVGGSPQIHNKTPSLHPLGANVLRMGVASVGYRYRVVLPTGLPVPFPQLGHPSLWITPSLAPSAIEPPTLTKHTVWWRVRVLEPLPWRADLFGATSLTYRWRRVQLEGMGIEGLSTAKPRVEHAERVILLTGQSWLESGKPWVSPARRVLDLVDRGVENVPLHSPRVGYTRQIAPIGFEATRWLKTIVPQAHEVYPRSFDATYGLAKIEHHRRYLRLYGITTYPEPQMHWGMARVWKSRQIVTLVEDQQSGLWPPNGSGWTLVANRNRQLRVTGLAAVRFGRADVQNGARAVMPIAVSAPTQPEWYKSGTVTFRVRGLSLEGLEPPYMGRWGVVWNKAAPLRPPGILATGFGQASAANTRRYRQANGFTPSAYGYPMVAPRIRTLSFEQRYTIHAPTIALPSVRLYTRYVESHSVAAPIASVLHVLESRFNRIITKWTHQSDLFGWAALRNLTPELGTRGRAADEWGGAIVRLQWRPVAPVGNAMQTFGGVTIADRTRVVRPGGVNSLRIGDKLRAIRIGGDPTVPQYIDLRMFTFGESGAVEAPKGFGIDPPDRQFGLPDMSKGYVFHDGSQSDMMRFGSALVTANTIRVQPGLGSLLVGEPVVGLRRRYVAAESVGMLVQPSSALIDMGSWGLPRMTPHTVYAVMEAPLQARTNHPQLGSRYVNDGVKVGMHTVSQWRGVLVQNPFPSPPLPGTPRVWSMRRYIQPDGRQHTRIGLPIIPGPQTILIELSIAPPAAGGAALSRPPPTPILRPQGLSAAALPTATVQHFHRTVAASGWLSQRLGSSSGGRYINMPDALHVGPPNLHEQVGFDAAHYGTSWVSHRVREVLARGHDSFVCDYDLENFAKRMRVRNGDDRWPGRQTILAHGHLSSSVGHAQLRAGLHYIRPDGNSDQYRKGAF